MKPSQNVAFGALGSISLYALWHQLVVKKGSRAVQEVGPRGLAAMLSGFSYRFASWLFQFSFNDKAQIDAGKVDPSRQYMIVWHPHGAFTINSLFFFTHKSATRDILGKPLFCGVADFLFQVPGLAEFLLLCNAKHVGTRTTEDLLRSGCNVGVNPGGVFEQVNTDHRKEVVHFPGNLGFVRLAIKHGVALLPCYNFGENQLFHTSETVRKINRFMYEKTGIGNLLIHGRGGIVQTPLFMNPLMLPDPGKPLACRLGEPVEVGPPDEHPSEEKVQEVFSQYCIALRKLFDEHKDTCLPPDVAATGLQINVRPTRQSKL